MQDVSDKSMDNSSSIPSSSSSSSEEGSFKYCGSRVQKPPLPGSSLVRTIFLKHLFNDKLCLMEFWKNVSQINLPCSRIQTMYLSYHSNKLKLWCKDAKIDHRNNPFPLKESTIINSHNIVHILVSTYRHTFVTVSLSGQ